MATQLQHRNLPLLLLQVREALMSRFRPLLTQNGITEQQWRVIRALLELGALEPRQLCQVCQILGPSLAGVLTRMEEQGLVARERMENDQRRVLVSLTPRSRAVARKLAPLVETGYQDLEKILGVQLMNETYAVLDNMLEKLAEEATLADAADAPIDGNLAGTLR